MSRRVQIVVSLLFFVVTFVPPIVTASGRVHPAGLENRPITPWPRLSPEALLHSETYKTLTDFFTDRIPGRDRAIRAREEISISVFDETASESIVAGEDGWLFVAAPLREPCVPVDEMARLRSGLTALAGLLESAGKTFRLLVVPDKNIAYPQHVPARDRRASCALANSLALRHAIRGLEPGYSTVADRARQGPELYYHGDEHWNARGALVATRELIDVLRPGLVDLSAYSVVPDGEVHPDNLAQFQGRASSEIADAVVLNRPSVDVVVSDGSSSTPGAQILHEQRTGGPLVPERVLVVADSFGAALQPLVSPWLGDVTWFSVVAGRFEPRLLSKALAGADTVVLVMLERNLRLRIESLAAAARDAFAG
jgi:hypothetical protein